MAQTKQQKRKTLEDLKEKIERQKAIVFLDFTGLKVKDLSNLRKKLKSENSELKVAKKTLMAIAFKDSYPPATLQPKPAHPKKEISVAQKIKEFKGEIALVFGYQDIILPAKTVWQFSLRNPNLKILGGFIEKKFREAEEIITLAQIPSREELLAKLVGSIAAPISNFVNVLQGNIKGLLYVLIKIKT